MAAPAKRKKKRSSAERPRRAASAFRADLARMTLDQKLGQLLMVYLRGRFTSAADPGFRELARWVREGKVGGLLLEAQRTARGIEIDQVYPTAALLNHLQSQAKVPLLVAADFETGTAMRLAEGTRLPHPMAIAATGDARDARAAGRITAIEARTAGVNWIFAPVADLNSNPENPIINIRSFGEEPESVARLVSEFIRGAQANGALATAKHFPGHGDTNVDSHVGLPVIAADRASLERGELVPFRAAIRAGVGSVMTGHLLVPALEPDPELPATLSPRIVDGLLRREMGYRGLVVTDSLDMAGVAMLYPPNRTAVLSIAAGADVLVIPPSPEAALAALREAVRDGRLPIEKIDAAVERILRTKKRLGLARRRRVDLDLLPETFAKPSYAREALEIASRGVTVLRNKERLLPLDSTRPTRALLVALSADPDAAPGADFENEIRPRVDSLEVRRADTRYFPAERVELPAADTYDVAIIALYVRVADRKGSVALPEGLAKLADRVLGAGKPAIVACFGSPYLVSRFPQAGTWIGAFSTTSVAEHAVGCALFGQTAISGRLPVSVPSVAARGAGENVGARRMALEQGPVPMVSALKPVYRLLDRGVGERVFPGGVLAVGHENHLVLHPFGRFSYEAKSPAVKGDTIYDVASLTKVVVTTTAAMRLVESGVVRLDAPVALYLPEWGAGAERAWREKATVGDLLLHSAGLVAHREFYREAKGPGAIVARAIAEPLEYEPETKIVYSDLDFILLGEIIRQVTGEELDRFATQEIFHPLGMFDSHFRPARRLRRRIPPTERDTVWRKRQVWGEVHDPNAYAMGGTGGHAGLFSMAGDLAVFCQMLLNGGIYAHRRLLARATIESFTARRAIAGAARGLGWDVPTENSSSGRYFSTKSFGHTGFTGTSIWIDPEKQLFVVLLTNRVHPSAENVEIRRLRPALHDAVVQGLGLAPHR